MSLKALEAERPRIGGGTSDLPPWPRGVFVLIPMFVLSLFFLFLFFSPFFALFSSSFFGVTTSKPFFKKLRGNYSSLEKIMALAFQEVHDMPTKLRVWLTELLATLDLAGIRTPAKTCFLFAWLVEKRRGPQKKAQTMKQGELILWKTERLPLYSSMFG